MNPGQKILLIIGVGFLALGVPMSILFGSLMGIEVALLPLVFVFLGAAFVIYVAWQRAGQARVRARGTRHAAKIYGYVDDTSFTVNDAYPQNLRVRYFDERGQRREVVVPTRFARGDTRYPIGATVDIFEHKGDVSWDPASVRPEQLAREDELMDDRPVEPDQLHIVAVTCPHCGPSFQVAEGYASTCPYCGQAVNA